MPKSKDKTPGKQDEKFINEKYMQKQFTKVTLNYVKRNGSHKYNQSLSTILSRILEVVFHSEHCFWLYAILCEHILPPNFYSQTLYP